MSTRPPRSNPPLTLALPPPSHTHPPAISTPTHAYQSDATISHSPRRAPLPPSPTYSTHPASQTIWLEDRNRGHSLDVSQADRDLPPLPGKSEKRLPLPPNSPHQAVRGVYAGAYDNKLVSSTLSHLPPIPALSPTSTGVSSLAHNTSTGSTPLLKAPSPQIATGSIRPPFSALSSSGIVVLPNGTALPTSTPNHDRSLERNPGAGVGRSIIETMAHSSPSSPWSLLTVHVLPLFAGSPLKTPIEDLNQLCHSHIIGTSQRAQPSRIVALLSSDFREFVASGMLTLKAKFETLDEPKIIGRAAEVWSFFWTQVLPYLEGVFLPFIQIRDLPAIASSTAAAAVPVRHILLSGFLLHILLPLLPRLVHLIANASLPSPSSDLQRILQMSLVTSTQARLSTFVVGQEHRDDEVRVNIENLAKTIQWKMTAGRASNASRDAAPYINRSSLQRGPSILRQRRRGWRASGQVGQNWGLTENFVTGDKSDLLNQATDHAWGTGRGDDEDDDTTPGQSYNEAGQRFRNASAMASTVTSTMTEASTIRGGDSVYDARTPQADPYRRVAESESNLNLSGYAERRT